MEKVNKRDFIKYVAKKNDIPVKDFAKFYEAMIDGIMDMMMEHKKVSFTRFGAFYLQKHKGHPVQFEADGSDIRDYVVFKFSASDTLNQRLREVCDVSQFDENGDAIVCNAHGHSLTKTEHDDDDDCLNMDELEQETPAMNVAETIKEVKAKKRSTKAVTELESNKRPSSKKSGNKPLKMLAEAR